MTRPGSFVTRFHRRQAPDGRSEVSCVTADSAASLHLGQSACHPVQTLQPAFPPMLPLHLLQPHLSADAMALLRLGQAACRQCKLSSLHFLQSAPCLAARLSALDPSAFTQRVPSMQPVVCAPLNGAECSLSCLWVWLAHADRHHAGSSVVLRAPQCFSFVQAQPGQAVAMTRI